MEALFGFSNHQYSTLLNVLTSHQKAQVKGHLVDADNRFNRIFPFFTPLHSELSPGLRIIDNFSDCFSFNLCNKEKDDKICLQQLDNMVIESSYSPSTAIIITDVSIKNNIAISILHMHIANSSLIKTLHHVAFITSPEAELFTIRCSINQASNKEDISKIIIITDSIYVAKKIFNLSSHSFQVHVVAILSEIHQFFINNHNNSIEFWECPSQLNWNLHKVVNKDSKAFNPLPVYPCKTLWDFSRKIEYNDILNTWKMTFQASDCKGRQFLNLLNKNFNVIKLSYAKGEP